MSAILGSPKDNIYPPYLHPCCVPERDNEARQTAGRVGTWEGVGSRAPGAQIRKGGTWDLGQAVLLEEAS